MRNRSRQRAIQSIESRINFLTLHREEKLELKTTTGIKDPTPRNAVRVMMDEERSVLSALRVERNKLRRNEPYLQEED